MRIIIHYPREWFGRGNRFSQPAIAPRTWEGVALIFATIAGFFGLLTLLH